VAQRNDGRGAPKLAGPRVAKRNLPITETTEQELLLQRSNMVRALVESLPASARARNPKAAGMLLRSIVKALRSHDPLLPAWDDYLADALEQAMANPKHAGAALGLIAKRARPHSSHKTLRDGELAFSVERLKRTGIALKGGRKGIGAFAQVACSHHTSVRTVQRAWDAHKALLKIFNSIGI
jgi:hypothetical protein